MGGRVGGWVVANYLELGPQAVLDAVGEKDSGAPASKQSVLEEERTVVAVVERLGEVFGGDDKGLGRGGRVGGWVGWR